MGIGGPKKKNVSKFLIPTPGPEVILLIPPIDIPKETASGLSVNALLPTVITLY